MASLPRSMHDADAEVEAVGLEGEAGKFPRQPTGHLSSPETARRSSLFRGRRGRETGEEEKRRREMLKSCAARASGDVSLRNGASLASAGVKVRSRSCRRTGPEAHMLNPICAEQKQLQPLLSSRKPVLQSAIRRRHPGRSGGSLTCLEDGGWRMGVQTEVWQGMASECSLEILYTLSMTQNCSEVLDESLRYSDMRQPSAEHGQQRYQSRLRSPDCRAGS